MNDRMRKVFEANLQKLFASAYRKLMDSQQSVGSQEKVVFTNPEAAAVLLAIDNFMSIIEGRKEAH